MVEPFPNGGRVDFKAEIAFDVDPNGVAFINPPNWEDVSRYFLDQSISITRGRANETEDTQVMQMSFELDNTDGRFTPDNAEGPYYPKVKRGRIFRYGIFGGDPYYQFSDATIFGTGASTPDNAAIDVTGDLEIILELQPYGIDGLFWIAGKYNFTSNQRSWIVFAQSSSTSPSFYRLGLEWSTDGTAANARAATTDFNLAFHDKMFIRITLDVNNGAGGCTINFYQARNLGEDWVLIKSVVGAGTTSVFNSTAPIYLAANPDPANALFNFIGKIHTFQLYNGISGTLVADAQFKELDPGTTAWTDSVGRSWTIDPDEGEITNYQSRFFGNIDSWQVTWPYGDTTGIQAPESRTVCQASSIRRRLGQGNRPIQSAIRRNIQKNLVTPVVAYWPLEDEAEAAFAGTGIPNGSPGVVNGFVFGANSDLVGSAPLPQLETVASFNGQVGVYTSPSPNAWTVGLVSFFPTVPTIQQEIITAHLTGGTIARVVFEFLNSTQYRIIAYDSGGGTIGSGAGSHSNLFQNVWGYWILAAQQNGANVDVTLIFNDKDNPDPIGSPTFGGSISFAATLGNVDYVSSNFGSQMADFTIGHIFVDDIYAGSPFTGNSGTLNSLNAFSGELAIARFARLCAEEEIACDYGSLVSTPSTVMGPQQMDTLLNIFSDVANSSNSIFLDARFFRGLQYIPLYDLINQPTQLSLSGSADDITNPLSPTLDDQFLRNAVESSRPDGSTAFRSNEASVEEEGEYLTQVTVNVGNDYQLGDDAGWRLHIGISEEMAYPPITIELAKSPDLYDPWLADVLDVGSVIELTDLPRQADPTPRYFILQGYTEVITPTRWTITLNCTPYEPYMVTWFDNQYVALVLNPIDSELDAGIDDDDTTFDVQLNGIDEWTTDPADFPILIEIGGEQMEVSTIGAEAGGVQQFTVTRSINGVVKSHSAGDQVTIAYPAFLSLV